MKTKFLALTLTLIVILSGCGTSSPSSVSSQSSSAVESSSSTPEPPKATTPKALSKTVSGVTVSVDPMVEMLAVVQYLSDYDKKYGLMTKHKTSYNTDIDETFTKFKDHEAVKFLNDTMMNGFAFDVPPTACMYLDENFAILPEFESSDFKRDSLSSGMNEFRDVMEKFYIDTNFGEFYNTHQEFYTNMIDTYAKGFPTWNMTEAMENYYSKKMAAYNIVLVPLFHQGGFGPSLEFSDGLHIYSIQGPYDAVDNIPLFGDSDAIAALVIHEFGHSFVPVNEYDNPVMVEEVKRSEYLMKPIEEVMSKNAYPSWSSAYEELVLRAAVIDILNQNIETDVEDLLEYEREVGFMYIDTAYEAIKEYTKNKDKYPVFDDFVPVITDALIAAYPDSTKAS